MSSGSAMVVVIPAYDIIMQHKLSHRQSSTCKNLTKLREAVRYVLSQAAQPWTFLIDSK